MRILFISNLYPPYHTSGYELGCQDIVESLKAREHQIKVLTSTYGLRNSQIEDSIHRTLMGNSKDSLGWNAVFLKECVNQTVFKRLCRDFQPDVAFFFNLTHISASLALLAQEMGISACYYFANNWFITMEKDPWYQLWPKERKRYRILRFLTRHYKLISPTQPLNTTHSIFANSYLKNIAVQLGKSSPNAAVIPWGIDASRFPLKEKKDQKSCRLLYVGQISPHKGLETAIKALELLNREYGYHALSMTIMGDKKSSPHYVTHLRNLADTLGVMNNVHFDGLTPRDAMPGLYHAHDIFVSPSSCEASMNITLIEAMSCGTAIVSTVTGGNCDILEDDINALVFAKENPRSCAEQINRLLKDPKLKESLRMNARNTVIKNFRIEQTVHSIEQVLEEAFRQRKTDRQPQTSERLLVSVEMDREVSLTDLISQTKRRLKLGNLAVFVRNWSRPKVFIHIVRRIFEKCMPFLPLLFFPIFYEGFFFLTGRRRKISKNDPYQIQKVLVIQLTDIGDVILTSPFLRELRRYLPHAWIVLMVQPRMFNLVEKCPHVNEVLPFDWRAAKNWNISFNGCIQWWFQSAGIAKHHLWRHHLDIAISTRWNNDPCQAASIILMYMSGAPLRIGYRDTPQDHKHFWLKGVNRLLTQGPHRGFPQHEVERQLDILRFLGANPIDSGLEVWTTREDEFFAQDILNRFDIKESDLLIAFAPGATWSYRRWPSSRFIELGRWLQESYNAYILIIGGRSDNKLALHIEQGMQSRQTANLAGKTTLREMASVLKHCKLFIGNDSGPLHVATAAGVPVIGFFGPGEYQRFKPWGENHEAISLGLSCSPCSENCLFYDPRCIKGIAVDQIKKIISKKLGSLILVS